MTPDRRAFSVAVFAVHDGEVLLVEHKRLRLLLPVGGEIEENETPLEAAKRELLEETGLEGDFSAPSPLPIPGGPPGLIGYEEHPAGSKGLHMNFCFAARVPSRNVKSDGSWNGHHWVKDAPAECPENVRVAVAEALRLLGRTPSTT